MKVDNMIKEIRAEKDREYESLNTMDKIQSELARALKRLDVAKLYGHRWFVFELVLEFVREIFCWVVPCQKTTTGF